MSKKPFSNSHPRRVAAEEANIALMLSGSYVRKTLDQDEYDRLKQTDFNALIFSEVPWVVVTNAKKKSKRGILARIANLSSDGTYVRYRHPVFPKRCSFATLSILAAVAYKPSAFLASLMGNSTLSVKRIRDGSLFTGILVGSEGDTYASLMIPSESPLGFDFIDIELDTNPYNKANLVSIVSRNPKNASAILGSISKSLLSK